MKSIFFLIVLCGAGFAHAHGEDKPGPNGGEIRMPGAFHTELVRGEKGAPAKVYLLDMEWKNPTVKDSAVSVSLDGKPAKDCKPAKDHFTCELGLANSVSITAKRAGQQGNAATYERKGL